MTKQVYEKFNETVFVLKLKNGMHVHILPKNEPYFTTYVELSIPFGALNLKYKNGEDIIETPCGTAHFLEHKIFAMPEGDAFLEFSKLGVEANAMTSYSQTSYLFIATQNVTDALTHLFDMIDTPYFTEDNVNQEKNIISEELKMYLDDPNIEMQNQLMEMMYFNHPLKYDIGGTLDSIKEISPNVLLNAYHNFYHPSNRLVTIAGKVDVEALKKFFKDYDLKHPAKKAKIKTIYPKEPKRLVEKQKIEIKEVGINKLMIGVKLSPSHLSSTQQIKKEMMVSLLLNILLGASSATYAKLIKDKMINQSFFVNSTFEKNAENIIIYAESKKVHKLKKLLIDILTVDAPKLVSEDAFERYKKVYLGQFIFALNNLETKAYLYGKYYHMGSSLYEVLDILKDVTYQQMIDELKGIQKKYISTLIYKKAK
ncbi:MAG: insulinase family protein [Acholeplasmataceae bacterium]|nr:insulinase family protein [Acholeplasmataceae bacterium]